MPDIENPALRDEELVGTLMTHMKDGMSYSDGTPIPFGMYPNIALIRTTADIKRSGRSLPYAYEDVIDTAKKVAELVLGGEDGQA